MDIKTLLLKENSKTIWDEVIQYVGEDEERFAALMQLFFSDELRVIQRSSQPISKIAEKQPRLIRPYLIELVTLLKTNPIDAVKRNTMRIFQFIEIPEAVEGDLFDIGLTYLKDAQEPIAVKAFSMTVLRKICEKYPELAPELIMQIEILVKERVSAGVTNRGQHELKRLQKIVAKH
mgnify:CR=1 FL=1